MQNEFTINDLPTYNPWVKRLLGLEEINPRAKTEAEIKREFEVEKWGGLLKWINDNNTTPGIGEVDELYIKGNTEVMAYYNNEFVVSTYKEIQDKYVDLVFKSISKYLPAPAIVELGSGYGSTLFNLAKKYLPEDQLLIGLEYSSTGVEVMNKVGNYEGLNFRTGHCNFFNLNLREVAIPPGAVFFTSYATMYVPMLGNSFVGAILDGKPKIVIHFEPVLEHCGEDLFGLLRRKYILFNDYNRNLLGVLEDNDKVAVENVQPALIGPNALLPASLISWVPVEIAKK